MDWKAITSEILSKLDIRAVYENLGVRFVGEPTEKGYLACYSFGEDKKKPSAAVFVGGSDNKELGRYYDRSNHTNYRLFEFCAHFLPGTFPSWIAARDHFAAKAGVEIKKAKKAAKRDFKENIEKSRWSDAAIGIFCRRKKAITAEAIKLAGGYFAKWPKDAPNPQSVLCFNAYGPNGLEAGPVGITIYDSSGSYLSKYCGKDEPPTREKVLQVTGSKGGLLNEYALQNIKDAEFVWLVEGGTCMLALQAAIPPSQRTKHVVVSASISSEYPSNDLLHFFKGKKVFVVGDADSAGDAFGRRWAAAIARHAVFAIRVELPYPILESHGRDTRDFFIDGGTFQGLIDLAYTFKPVEPAIQELNGHSAANGNTATSNYLEFLEGILKVSVLGLDHNDVIHCYSKYRRKVFTIDNPDRLNYASLLQKVGDPAVDHVSPKMSDLPPGKQPLTFVREAFGIESSRLDHIHTASVGRGIWKAENSDDIIIVDSGEAALWDGDKFTEIQEPKVGSMVIDFSPSVSWCNFEVFGSMLNQAKSHDYCESRLQRLESLFSQWVWKYPQDSEVFLALLLSTWVQSMWYWRPLVAVTGGSDSGKTTIFEKMALMFLKDKMCASVVDPTAAGIRQVIRNTSIALFIDEFEKSKHRNEILQVLRSSSKGGSIIRGTPGQKAVNYGIKHVAWVGSTEAGLKKEPDKNRFIGLELFRPKKAKHGAWTMPNDQEFMALGMELAAMAVVHFNKAYEMVEKLQSHRVENVPGRVAQSYAVPAAMITAIRGLGLDDAKETMNYFLANKFDAVKPELDEEELMRDILQSEVHYERGLHKLVSELIVSPHGMTQNDRDLLERKGIALCAEHPGPRSSDSTHMFIVPSMVQRNLLIRNSTWTVDMDIEKLLMRFPGAKRVQRTLYGVRSRGVIIPLFRLFKEEEAEPIHPGDQGYEDL